MKSSSKNRMLSPNEKDIACVRELIKLGDEESIRRDVDMVVEWYNKQQHLPRVQLDRDVVERVMIARKGSVEQTKQKIEKLYTLRTAIPEMASPRDILHPDIQKQLRTGVLAPLPKLNHDLTRVSVYKANKNTDEFVYADTFKYMFMVNEYRFKHDYCLGERMLHDLQHFSLSHISKVNPIVFKNGELMLAGYGNRIFGIHIINAPPFLDKLLSILKSMLSSKLFSRIFVHSNLEELHKNISKSILPKEYGGEEASMEELAEQWKQELEVEENRQFLISQEGLRSDERLRVGERLSDDMLGIPGSFKKINID